MKKIILAISAFFAFSSGPALAAGGGIALDKAPVNLSDTASLQNGARLFVNYCLNCHSAAFMRYNRLQDLGFTEQQIKDNLLFTSEKVGDLMKAAIDPQQAKEWFGANPPDLTHLPAHLLSGRRKGHRLEQPRLPQRGHAARAVGTARPAPPGVREAHRTRP
jgi:ubiquinol-cytochrome c reductase cytochrome c1 subunit